MIRRPILPSFTSQAFVTLISIPSLLRRNSQHIMSLASTVSTIFNFLKSIQSSNCSREAINQSSLVSIAKSSTNIKSSCNESGISSILLNASSIFFSINMSGLFYRSNILSEKADVWLSSSYRSSNWSTLSSRSRPSIWRSIILSKIHSLQSEGSLQLQAVCNGNHVHIY